MLHFSFQTVQKVLKMFGILEKKTEISTKIWAKKIRHNFFSFRGVRPHPPLDSPFHRWLRPLHILQGLLPQSLVERQLIENRINWFSCITGQHFWVGFDFWILNIYFIQFLNKFHRRLFSWFQPFSEILFIVKKKQDFVLEHFWKS